MIADREHQGLGAAAGAGARRTGMGAAGRSAAMAAERRSRVMGRSFGTGPARRQDIGGKVMAPAAMCKGRCPRRAIG
ncbi:hypothetical protein B0A89_04980 [Paracoccus contaminans]|uniref:Uncharacterized protein n=1 Tax=Paracoccus contaminans TaxID=1945662 RepID=A0A1W6CW07_9RHOB|nr:hypothetical protein B0A89_04980 [Paracoccus contaminans]